VALALLVLGSSAAPARFLPGGGSASSGSVTNVIAAAITNENVPPSSSPGFQIGDLSATVTGGGPCTTCTWTMINTGSAAQGNGCGSQSNNFQVANFGSGAAHLEVLSSGLTARIWGATPTAVSSSSETYICAKATPAVGASYVFAFSIIVRAPMITSVSPRKVQYTLGVAQSIPLSATICWTNCHQGGSAPTPTFTLGSDAACTASGISISGSSLNLSSSYAGAGVCHIVVAATGANCAVLGYVTATPTTCNAAVNITQGAYVGPGDDSALAGLTWYVWAEPYAFSAAYAAAGGPIWKVIRESDQQPFTINALSNGDMDVATMATDCDTSICALDDPVDQSGNSPANDIPAWSNSHGSPPPVTIWHPIVLFNSINGSMPAYNSSNPNDRLLYNPTTYTGAGTTGTLGIVAQTISVPGSNSYLMAFNDGVTPGTFLYFPSSGNGGGAGVWVGPHNFTGGTGIQDTAPAAGAFHSIIATINGTSSILDADGNQTTGTLGTAAINKPAGIFGDFGGGSNTGNGVGFFILASVLTSTQLSVLCTYDQINFATSGSC